jgi:uracil permease
VIVARTNVKKYRTAVSNHARRRLGREYRLRSGHWFIGGQMLFVAFGRLVPLLTGLDPNVALFTAGAGTLIFQLCTRGKAPLTLRRAQLRRP